MLQKITKGFQYFAKVATFFAKSYHTDCFSLNNNWLKILPTSSLYLSPLFLSVSLNQISLSVGHFPKSVEQIIYNILNPDVNFCSNPISIEKSKNKSFWLQEDFETSLLRNNWKMSGSRIFIFVASDIGAYRNALIY